MANLFNRVVRLTLGTTPALVVVGLRVQFQITRTLRKEPNNSDISIFNLNQDHRAQIKVRGLPVIFEAGYGQTLAQVFNGQARLVDHKREGPDWVSKIQIGDGWLGYRYARVTQTWPPGTPVSQVVQFLVNAIGPQTIDTGRSIGLITDQFAKGYAVQGKASNELDRVLSGRGFEWSIQDGRVQLLQIGQHTTETAVLLSPQTGLVGSPEHGTPEPSKPLTSGHILKLRSLLQPTLRPGALVNVQAEGITGFYRCQKVTHEGDSHGGNWYSNVEAQPIT